MPVALDGLNRAQEAAVTHADGPLVVVAGAGTGKTQAVVHRFAWLVDQGLPGGADPRAHVLGPRPRPTCASGSRCCSSRRTRSSTSRPSARSAFASSRTRRSRPGVDPFLSPVTPADRLALLLERIDDLSLRAHEIRGNPAPLLASFVSRIDRLKNETISAAGLPGARPAPRRRGDQRRHPRPRGARARVRAALRRPRPPARRARRARFRRPRAARLPAPPRAAACPRARGAPLPARARRRVPGDDLRRGDAAPAADRGAPAGDGRRGRTRASSRSSPRRAS